ncbi:ComEA family DNA-binding protein [Psychroflexus aestuariivivens]|uniref:ComEA family DNA-binding protein n=1 Tax=Psychroflexus aestuariivivens TaxID=1795040 RepID=UPI000FD7F9EC|nr:helix-hairpin-helix domain-containing protein [Psychroflexus aestuariivivens]
MKNKKFRFGYNHGDRNGIFILILILILGIAFNYFSLNIDHRNSDFTFSNLKTDSLQKIVDSLKKEQSLAKKRKIYPFNPNFITKYKGYTLGMSESEIERLHAFRDKDQWINSKADFQKVTQVSDEWMTKYQDYFKFPDWVIEARSKNQSKSNSNSKLSYAEKIDLNKATASELTSVSGIGEVLSERIIKYRYRIGGFSDIIQLKDVYGLKSDVIKKLENKFALKTPKPIKVVNINEAEVLDISELPYFDYEMARKIVNFVKLREGIADFEELSKIEGFPAYKLDRIQLYLTIEE